MDIAEIQKSRLSLEMDIAEKIMDFENATGLAVVSVGLEHRSKEIRVDSTDDRRVARVPVVMLGIRAVHIKVDLNATLALPKPEESISGSITSGSITVRLDPHEHRDQIARAFHDAQPD